MTVRLAACFVFFSFVHLASAAPLETMTSTSSVADTPLDCHNESSDVYDQRQNGTENYRIHVNGVVVLVAPAETVLQAAQLSGLQMGTESESSTPAPPPAVLKPKPKPPSTVVDKVPDEGLSNDPANPHPKDKNNLKLLNLLHMFRSIRHESEGPTEHGHKSK